jgi:protein arginine N-methyltransferase 1
MSSPRIEAQSCDYYFDHYAHFGIHEDMLKDSVRMNAYRDAIAQNPSLFKGKVVLDVGCGTGIFSLFAAKYGARKVYAVEKSAIIEHAVQIVEANGLSDKIALIQGSIEEAVIAEPVDIILSDWMGYCLFYKSMLPAVISARDRFMKPDGLMFPSRAQMFIVGIEDAAYRAKKIGFWDSVYTFSYAPIKRWALIEPLVETCPEERIITDVCKFVDLDLNTCTVEMMSLDAPFTLVPEVSETMHAFVVWFTMLFEGSDQQIDLSTSPYGTSTRWRQTLFYLEQAIDVTPNCLIEGRFQMQPNFDNPKDQEFVISYRIDDTEISQTYKMT